MLASVSDRAWVQAMLDVEAALARAESRLGIFPAAAAAAQLAERHRATVMAARTLLQQALPTTFGLKAAGWLIAIVEARAELLRVAQTRLAVQFGGAAGTMAALSGRGLDVMRELSVELTLAEPTLPWHTARARLVD